MKLYSCFKPTYTVNLLFLNNMDMHTSPPHWEAGAVEVQTDANGTDALVICCFPYQY